MSLIFYDTETTGTETAFDQILQFAAIRTDADLNELERFEIRCKLQPHIVPAPGAMLVNKLPAARLEDEALPSHYEMVRAIRDKLLSWSPASFIGYNSINFDEHLLRQALYQTLHHPYLTSSKNCTRCDVMRIVQASAQFAPNALALPVGDKGQHVFKLDKVAPLNGFRHERAHDALGDVEATIFLSRLLRDRAPDLWSAAMRFGRKATAIDYLQSERIFCFGEHYYGKPYAFTVTGLGANQENTADYFVFDLATDPTTLVELDDAGLANRLRRSPKPIRTVKVNAAPLFVAFPEAMGATSANAIASDVLEERVMFIENNPALRDRLIRVFLSTKEPPGEYLHVEQQIYADFTSATDLILLDQFHKTPWDQRVSLLEMLSDKRLKPLGLRLIYFERPDVLDADTREKLGKWKADRLTGSADAPWLTLDEALANVVTLMDSLDSDGRAHLREHEAFLRERLNNLPQNHVASLPELRFSEAELVS